MFHRTTNNMKEACGIMYGKMEKSLKLLRRIYFVEIIVLLIVGGIVGVFMSLYAAPNKSFVYQGRITGADFLPLDDATYYMRIKLFDALTGGTCFWSTGADRTGANCTALNSAANVPVVLTRSLFSLPMGDTAYHANMPNIASLDFKNTTYFMDVSFSTASGGTYETFTTRTKLGSAASAVAVLDALQANMFNQVPGSYTQINDADGITTSDATITVDSTAGYPSAGTILIDTEVMTYTATTATTLTGVVRGALGTTAATHNDNATVKTYLFSGAAGTATATLSSDHTNAVTTITVGSTAGYPTSGTIRIDNELITYTGTTTTTLTGAARGARGTTAAAHTSGAIVKLDIFPTYFITSDGSAFVNSNSTSTNPQIGFQVSGTTNYTLGIDRLADSTANKFKISTNNVATTGTGTLSSASMVVTGVGTAFITQISIGSNITASGQTRTVDSISSNTSLTTETAFSPAISSGTSFTFTRNLLALDSRSTFATGAQYSAFTFYGLNNTLASSFDADYTTLTVTPPTITLSESTQVTSLMESIFFFRPTIASIAAGITDASTFTVAGPPLLTAGAMTNAYAVKVNSLTTNGGAAPTNAYGLAVAAPTGATNNYAAIFTGGNVGIGTTAPITQLHVAGNVPSAAHLTSSVQTGAGFSHIHVQGRYLYATGLDANKFYIYDTSKLGISSPVLNLINTGGTGTTTAAGPQRVKVSGRYAYILNQTANKLSVYDISNPSSPTLMGNSANGTGTITTSGAAVTGSGTSFNTGLAIGNTITVSGQTRTIASISGATSLTVDTVFSPDIGAGTAFTYIAPITTQSGPNAIAVQGRYAYVVSTTAARLEIFDISNPASPTVVNTGGLALSSGPNSIAIQGRYVYIANSSTTTFSIVDVSNPTSPSIISNPTVVANAIGITVQGRYAYVVSGPPASTANGTLQIFDISNPASVPAVIGTVATGNNPTSEPVVQGRYLYLNNPADFTVAGTMQIFDVSNPASPSSVGTVGTGTGPVNLDVAGRYVFVPNSVTNTIQVFDVGGSYVQQMEVGGLEATSGQIRNNLSVNNDLSVGGGINVGIGGMYSAGPLTVTGLEGASGTASAFDVRNSTGTSVFFVQNTGRVGFGVVAPSFSLSLGGSSAQTIAVEAATANNAGNNLSLFAGNSGSGTNLIGGNLTLTSGNSTGTGQAKVVVQVPQKSASGATSNLASTMLEFVNGHIAIVAQTAVPTLGTCTGGTLATSPQASDTSGKITGITGDSCALTFTANNAYTNAPVCVAQYEGSDTRSIRVSSISTTSVTFTFSSTPAAAATISYFCVGLGSQ
ncbi:MAG: hypothetical protein AAB400_03690 [Patescibacteria group bacterium]